jgi:signal transduction histidine kinase
MPACIRRRTLHTALGDLPVMKLHGLTWRLGLPLLLVVVAETVLVAMLLSRHLEAEGRERFAALAATNASFVVNSGLRGQLDGRLAEDLERVTGLRTFFRVQGRLLAPATFEDREWLEALVADGRVQRHGAFEAVGVPLQEAPGSDHAGRYLLFVRERVDAWLDPIVLQVLASFWLLTGLFAWLVVRSLVRPLRSLAGRLPTIDRDAGQVPEAARRDEIGDVARAFLATRGLLHDEREQRARAEKLAVLGRMSASLAHEIQNPVAAIQLHAQLLLADGPAPTAELIQQEVRRIEALVEQWLFVGRPEPPTVRPADLRELLAAALRALAARLRHAEVQVTVAPPAAAEDCLVACDRKRIALVFGNVLVNAIAAMPRGGALTIAFAPSQDAVAVAVQDAGAGFSATALAHFGEYFYSEREGGMGIGLAVSREIVRAHGGELTAANEPGGGARVVIRLPRRPPGEPQGDGTRP